MTWEVEYTDEFGEWWDTLDEGEKHSLAVGVMLLQQKGPALAFPYSSGIVASRHRQMRELRVQHKG